MLTHFHFLPFSSAYLEDTILSSIPGKMGNIPQHVLGLLTRPHWVGKTNISVQYLKGYWPRACGRDGLDPKQGHVFFPKWAHQLEEDSFVDWGSRRLWPWMSKPLLLKLETKILRVFEATRLFLSYIKVSSYRKKYKTAQIFSQVCCRNFLEMLLK